MLESEELLDPSLESEVDSEVWDKLEELLVVALYPLGSGFILSPLPTTLLCMSWAALGWGVCFA